MSLSNQFLFFLIFSNKITASIQSSELKNPLAPKDTIKEKLKSVSFEKRVAHFENEEHTTPTIRTGNLTMRFTPSTSPSQRKSKVNLIIIIILISNTIAILLSRNM
jgi:hypothetical protein